MAFNWPWKRTAAPIGIKDSEPFTSEFLSAPSHSGVQVTERRALGLTAHFACVRVIATTLASLPIHIYERTADGRERAAYHPLGRLLHDRPNPYMTAFSFIEGLQAQISNRGVAFAEIVYNRRGEVAELWPIPPGKCQVQKNAKTNRLEYHFPESGTLLPDWKILHVPGLSFDGLNSFSPVGLFMQSFGLGLAVEEYGARFFGNGTNIGGTLATDNKLSDVAHTRLTTSVKEGFEGLSKSHGLMILEEGLKYTPIGMKMEEIQFIESRKFTATEMARIHGVPPHLIADLEHATFSNIEEQGIEAVVYCFRPWAVRWEQALNARLLTPEEQGRYYIKFEIDGLLRGNAKGRFDAYRIGREIGVYSANEIRQMEDMNRRIDPEGDSYVTPLNMKLSNKTEEKEEDEK
jgi:HK97 family phage portal protein